MRVSICVQLGSLVFLATSIGLTVVALATWYTNHTFVKDVRSTSLMLTASLKSAQLASNLLLMQTLVRQASLRRSPQAALEVYYREGYSTLDQWNWTAEDYDAMFAGNEHSRIAVQARIYHKEDPKRILFSRTAPSMEIEPLPYERPDGQSALLGDPVYGYVPELYPQFEVHIINRTLEQYEASYDGKVITMSSPLLSGPYKVSDRLTLVSITMPIINNTSSGRTIGWLTVALDARLIKEVAESREGLGYSGISLLVGPSNIINNFPAGYLSDTPGFVAPYNFDIHFLLPSGTPRDLQRFFKHGSGPAFDWTLYPAVRTGFTCATGRINNAGSALATKNERNSVISIGHAIVNSSMVDWMIVVERSHAEVWAPMNRLRRVILSCAFGTMAGMLAFTFPIAHYLSRPVRRLRDATRTTVQPQLLKEGTPSDTADDEHKTFPLLCSLKHVLPSYVTRYQRLHAMRREQKQRCTERRHFVIPSKVKDGRHIIQDELTELTGTFNKMVVELMTRYEELEQRVRQRTAELELSKEAAEAADKSKTLFIANISHELKTPLNGIMGMLAVCLSEDNSPRLKQSLEIIYKSGDLLSNLLTELLTFSEIEIGQHSSLDEKEFKLGDIGSQVLAIFGQQAEEGGNALRIIFEGPNNATPDNGDQKSEDMTLSTSIDGPLRDMLLYGDEHLILRVVLNLVSNSLKFTPPDGTITVTIRCTGELDPSEVGKTPVPSQHSSSLGARPAMPPLRNEPTSKTMVHCDSPISSREPPSPYPSTSDVSHPRFTKHPQGQWLSFEFEVQDTGLGIPEHLHSKIFEPFVQGDLNLNKKYSGTGLGLSICSRLAGLLKGTMSMRSQVGKGSVFVMSIPLKRLSKPIERRATSCLESRIAMLPTKERAGEGRTRSQSAGSALMTRPTHFQPSKTLRVVDPTQHVPRNITSRLNLGPYAIGQDKTFLASAASLATTPLSEFAAETLAKKKTERHRAARILVAEDNKTNQEVITRMLQLEGLHNVTIARDGQEAVDRVRESVLEQDPYELILMDVQMPNLDGLQATRLIRGEGFSAPIVALTAYTDKANMEECSQAGMDAFLSKPILRSALGRVLQTHLSAVSGQEKEGEVPVASV